MKTENNFVSLAIDAAIKLFLLGLMVTLSYQILKPFVMPVLWAIIIAVAFSPMITKLSGIFGGKRKLVCILFGVIAAAILIVPVILLASTSLEAMQVLIEDLKDNKISFIPPAPERLADIPLVGQKLTDLWNLAATDIPAALSATKPFAENLAAQLTASVGGLLGTVVQFVISFAIAAVLMISPEKGFAVTRKISLSFDPVRGEEFTKLTIATIRGVMTGVVGVAVIQSVLATIGMVAMGMSTAVLIGVLVLICAVVQLPPILVLGPVAAFTYSTHSPTAATIFLIWSFLVSASDGVLKPVLMARGVDTPMLVILLGAIGGMMLSGIIGLFVGAVIVSISYAVFMAWVNEKQSDDEVEQESSNDAVPSEE
ncbi:AI-2E family transporter [Rubritalea marina]|uniref:AI-2E family transporter n=1 Tax=Rubritalea marina TaxID=361055 RepID=UPI000367E131|nr:AI-2E family transporter [Rubritalea marina]